MSATRRRTLDPDARQPLYEQLAELLRDQILSGEIPAGRRIPSMRELTQQYEISNRTVDSAVKLLKGDGLIEFERGKGLYVVPEAKRRPREG